MQPERRLEIAIGLDIFVVVLFAAAGRRSHQQSEGFVDVLETAAPFLIGLGVAWLLVRAWRRPMSLFTGIAIWPLTVLVGMLTRNIIFDKGTATSFVLVTMLFFGGTIVGWRLAAAAIVKRLTKHKATAALHPH